MSPSAELASLRQKVRSYASALVCYSGGIDSALVAAIALEQLGPDASLALTAVSPSLAPAEKLAAQQTARTLGLRHLLVESNEMARPEYVANGSDRCFHCKTELYEISERYRILHGLQVIVNGTNSDDLGDYRPGLLAARNAVVKSPLAELGLDKAAVRRLARELGLEIWDKPASACLSSRLPYGTRVTPERLQQVGEFEEGLRSLGFQQVRVRWHERIARLEVPIEELTRLCADSIRGRVVELGKRCGFVYVTLDLAGYRQGSHNEVLPNRSLPLLQ